LAFLEDYLFWRVAEFLIDQKGYRILKFSKEQEELWLEKTENKQAQIIRLLRYNLDWSNWLQRDIEVTANNGERIRKKFAKGEIKILNLYFSAYPPVDDYSFRLSEPYINIDSPKVSVKSILFHRANAAESLGQIKDIFGNTIEPELSDDHSVLEIEGIKKRALSVAFSKAKAEQSVFQYGKPFFTYIFIALQILVYLVLEAAGGSTDTSTLIKFGAKFNPLILEGEWWRFFAPIFIHIGLLHLFMNTLALFYLGTMVERLYGNYRFLFIYIFAGFSGVLASFIYSPNLSAGASGAIFGCFGSLLYFGMINPRLFWRTLGLNILIVLGINLAFGFTIPGIDNAGHIGGLIGGFAAAGIMHLPKRKRLGLQFIFLAAASAIIFYMLQYGFSGQADVVDERSILVLAQQHIQDEEYDEAYELLTTYAGKHNSSAEILFLLSFTEIKKGSLENAKEHLLQVVEMEPGFHEAFYNLALLYMDEKNFKKAKGYAEKAVELKPDQESYQNTMNQIKHYLESSVSE
jgi:rhomboid protease GluP